ISTKVIDDTPICSPLPAPLSMNRFAVADNRGSLDRYQMTVWVSATAIIIRQYPLSESCPTFHAGFHQCLLPKYQLPSRPTVHIESALAPAFARRALQLLP